MKKIISVLFFIAAFTSICNSQTIDTVSTYGFGKMPPIYFGNRVYWERHYEQTKDEQSSVMTFIALSYNECHIGIYTAFYPNGTIRSTGQYLSNTTDDRSDLKSRGLCSVQDGEWKDFAPDGTLTKTYIYENGKVIKEY